MFLTVRFPLTVRQYQSTDQWFIDPRDGWTIADLTADLNFSGRVTAYHIERDAVTLDVGALVTTALSDGNTIDLVED